MDHGRAIERLDEVIAQRVEFSLWRTGYNSVAELEHWAKEGDPRAIELMELLMEEMEQHS